MATQQVFRLFHDARHGPPLVWNGGGSSPLLVCIPAQVMRDVIKLAMRGLPDHFPGGEQPDKAREVLGIFLGASVELDGRKMVVVQKMVPIDIRENSQPDYCEYRAEDKARIDHSIDRSGLAAYKEVGWFHTHPEHPIFLSPPDQSLMSSHFSQPDHFALVVKPKEGLGGIFVWDRGKVDGSEEDLAARGGPFSLQPYYTHQDWQKLVQMGAVNPHERVQAASAPGFTTAPSFTDDAAMEEAFARENTFIPRTSQAPARPPAPTTSGSTKLMFLVAGVLFLICLGLGWRLWKQGKSRKGPQARRAAATKKAPDQRPMQAVIPTRRAQMATRKHLPSERILPARRSYTARRRHYRCLQVELSFHEQPSLGSIQRFRGEVSSLLTKQLPQDSVTPICRILREQKARYIRCLVPSRKRVRWSKQTFRRALDAQQSLRGYVLSAERCKRCPCR